MRKRFIDDMELPLENEIEIIPEEPEPPKIYTITLADGRILSDLGLNGNNYVSQTKVDEDIFKDNLSVMTVSDGETETVYHNVALIQQQEWADGTWYLCFREKSLQEIQMEALERVMAEMGIGTETKPVTTLDEAQTAKLAELSKACSQAIIAGCDVELSEVSGHISLTAEDQINLTAALNVVEQGAAGYPYHLDGELCAVFSAGDIRLLAKSASSHKLYHTTYYNHLAAWVRRCKKMEKVQAITYGSELPKDLAENMQAILEGVGNEV